MKFTFVCLLLGLALLLTAVLCWWLFPKKKDLWRAIPREKRLGVILGTVCLIWSAYHIHLSFPWMGPYLILMVVVVAVISYFLLDYLFCRSLGGILLLTLNWTLHEAFVLHVPFRPILSGICYFSGIFGFILIAAPYRFRDLLEKISICTRSRVTVSVLLGITGLLFCFVSAAGYVQ